MAKKRGHSPEDDDGAVVDENRANGEDMEDDDDGRGVRRGGGGGLGKKKKKFKVMSSSGQTDSERRVLRRRQRELNADIVLGASSSARGGGQVDGDDARAAPGEDLERLREQNNELWGKVHYTREAVLDSENVDLIASKAARQAERIVQVPRYDAARLAQGFAKKGSIRSGSSFQFDWRCFDFQVGICFNALPSNVSFLYGPLDAEYAPKERKKPERRKRYEEVESEDEEEDHPEGVDQDGKKKGSDGNELSAVEQHIKVIHKTLSQKAHELRESADERSQEYESQISQEIDDDKEIRKQKKAYVTAHSHVDAVKGLFNPRSFTQTVENVFHFSFLVKKGDMGIKARDADAAAKYGAAPGPVIRPYRDESDKKEPRQAIVSLNMKDWRDMCRAYEVEESDVPHRVGGKVAKKEKKEKKRKSNN